MAYSGEKRKIDTRVEIYSLSCPLTKEVRYIGKANNSEKRLRSHIRDSRRRNTPVYCWIRTLTSNGMLPIMSVIVTVESSEWRETEKSQIIIHKSNGCRLLNVAEGGDEPFCSTETRAANGKSVAISIHSDPVRRKLWEQKKMIAETFRFFKTRNEIEKYNKLVGKANHLSRLIPDIFGSFSTYVKI